MAVTIEPKPEDVKEAIRLKCANCWGVLAMANSLGGSDTPAWTLAHTTKLKDLLDHAEEKKIDLTGLLSAVEKQPVQQSLYYLRATGGMTEAEFQAAFRKWQRGE